MSWLVDADVLCQPVKSHGDRAVIQWLEREQAEFYRSSIVIDQVAYCIRTKEGQARTRLQEWLRRSVDVIEGRILNFNVSTAHAWADHKFQLGQIGQPMPIEDSYIAATARRHNLTFVTGNDTHFRRPGLKVFNPFKELPSID